MRGGPKVFCIGWHKTGTTSLGHALVKLRFKTFGWHGNLGMQLISRWHEGHPELKSLISSIANEYDAFEDLPWPLLFKQCYELYPDARFILSVRKDAETWLNSYRKHVGNRRWVGHFLIYGTYDPHAEPETHVAAYEAHNREVEAFFAGKPNFLKMCFENGDGWDRLCAFLGEANPGGEFPHSNPARDRGSW